MKGTCRAYWDWVKAVPVEQFIMRCIRKRFGELITGNWKWTKTGYWYSSDGMNNLVTGCLYFERVNELIMPHFIIILKQR
ncbi:hypothetical protein RRG08_060848 [Elysia crispata]|uniref:Uncharacterized protein n=1 Tax=Elysia crispata TaxID=231223 RepID=A0AAE0ZGG6_9GAST|nr:hypothetical protein RRG08_060848 [Elysia crispata]